MALTAPRIASGPSFSNVVTGVSEAMSIKYNTMVYDLRSRGEQVTVLSLGEAFFDIPLYDFKKLPFPDIYHYSHSRGIPELRKQLSHHFRERYDVPFDADSEILITAGSKAAIYMTLLSVLDPGDEVLIPEPAWVSYTEQVKLCHAKPVGIPYDFPLSRIAEKITPKTKVIIINTPHNPSGYVYKRSELEQLLSLARQRGIWLMSDEAYSEFVLDDSFVSLGALDREKTNSILFNSVSKNHGISGWRLGYVIANRSLINQVLKVNQHLVTCPATILEHYVSTYFKEILETTEPQIRAVVEKRQQVEGLLDEIGLEYLKGTGTFYLFVSTKPSRLGSEEFCTRLLKESHVCAVPGIGYGDSCDGFVRISVGTTSIAEIVVALKRMKALIDKSS